MRALKRLCIMLFKTLVILGVITLCLLLIVWGLFALVSQAPHRITETWQTVNINSLGTFRVPEEWNIEERSGFLYITDIPMADGNYTIYMIGTGERDGLHSHMLFEGVERGETLHTPGFNNSAGLLVIEYLVDRVIQEHYIISFNNLRTSEEWITYELFVWNIEVVDRWHVEQIAKTFLRQRDGFDIENAGRLVQ